MSQDTLNYDPSAYQAYSQYGYDQSAYGQTTYGYTQATTQNFTSQIGDKDAAPKNRLATAARSGCILATLIAAAIAVVFLVPGSLLSFRGTEAESTEEDTQVPPVPPVFPVVRMSRRSSDTAVSATDASTAMTPTASTQSPRRVMDEQPLVCTMGANTSSPQMFPLDGLCEYIFFDSVEKDNRNPLMEPDRWDNDLRTFLDIYSQYSITAFGIGFSFDKAFSLARRLNTTSSSLLQPFWSRNIFHFGILDTVTYRAREVDVSLALDVLKALDRHADSQRNLGNPSFIFFAGVVFDSTWLNFYKEKFANVYKPDLFIAQGHYFYGDNTLPQCLVMPPTVVQRPQGHPSYQHDLSLAGDTINQLSFQGVAAIWALSVTMKGRFTMPATTRVSYDFLVDCVSNRSAPSFGTYYSEICTSRRYPQYVYNSAVDAVLAFHGTDIQMFAYDDEVALCKKLCTIKGQHPTLRFGIAVYDVDYEDFSNSCSLINKYEAFSRLHAVRIILNYFRTKFNTASDVLDCAVQIT